MFWFAVIVDILVALTLCLSWRCGRAIGTSSAMSNADNVSKKGWFITLVIAAAGAVSLAVVPIVLLNAKILGTRNDTGPTASHSVPDARTAPVDPECSYAQQTEVDLTIGQVDPVDGSIDVNAVVCIANKWLFDIEATPLTGPPISMPPLFSRLPTAFNDVGFALAYQGNWPSGTTSHFVPIRQVRTSITGVGDAVSRNFVSAGTFRLPVIGNGERFPFDTYSTEGDWSLQLLPTATLESDPRQEQPILLPFNLQVVSRAANLAFKWLADGAVIAGVGGFANTTVEARRSDSTRIFALLLVALPMLLFVGMLTAVPLSLRPELFVGVGAFLLAILPVRAVLVPTDVSGLTLVDYLLGAEMTVMVSATLLVAVSARLPSRRP